MLFFSVLVLSVLSVLAAGNHSYRRTDPVTGQTLRCDRCPPGSRLRAHCTSSRRTECSPCGPGLFTEFWNFIPDCLRCDACSDLQRVARPCNGTVNTVCECEPGFYWDQHFCKRHSRCKAGHGVRAAGTAHRDTECELCADGWFANISEAHAACGPHRSCGPDQHLLMPGARWHDNVCATCRQLEETGWAGLLAPVLDGLHLQYRTSTQHLEQLVNRRLKKKLRKRHALRTDDASMEELDLPKLTEESHLGILAGKIARRVRRFLQNCDNSISDL